MVCGFWPDFNERPIDSFQRLLFSEVSRSFEIYDHFIQNEASYLPHASSNLHSRLEDKDEPDTSVLV